MGLSVASRSWKDKKDKQQVVLLKVLEMLKQHFIELVTCHICLKVWKLPLLLLLCSQYIHYEFFITQFFLHPTRSSCKVSKSFEKLSLTSSQHRPTFKCASELEVKKENGKIRCDFFIDFIKKAMNCFGALLLFSLFPSYYKNPEKPRKWNE